VIDAVYYDWMYWDGRADTPWSQALGPAESEMGADRLSIAHLLFAQYRAEYDLVFEPDLDAALDPASADASRFPAAGGPGSAAWEAMAAGDREIVNRIFANFGKAIEAYERLLVTRDAPFDRYVAGDHEAISLSAKRGLALFIGRAACVQCHSGPFFTDQHFHVLGVPQRGDHVPATDDGRLPAVQQLLDDPFNGAGSYSDDPDHGEARLRALTSDPAMLGRFRTKSLREIARTAPYMHDGAFETLHDVLEFYDDGGGNAATHGSFSGSVDPLIRPLGLADRDYDDLVAFLETLSGEPLPAALLEDTSH
jgi:cytochrome c peroxidase